MEWDDDFEEEYTSNTIENIQENNEIRKKLIEGIDLYLGESQIKNNAKSAILDFLHYCKNENLKLSKELNEALSLVYHSKKNTLEKLILDLKNAAIGIFDLSVPDNYDFKIFPILRGWKKIKHIFKIAKRNNCVICGGYVRYMISEDKDTSIPGDVDVFPRDENSSKKVLEEFKNLGYSVKFENEMSYTLSSPNRYATYPIVQIIKPVKEGAIVAVGTLEEILKNFDFTVVRAGIIDKYNALADYQFQEHELAKKLVIRNIHCPVSSLIRVCKYAKKGYWINPSDAILLFIDWDNRDQEYRTRIIELFDKMNLTESEIDQLEKLLRID